MSSEKDEVQNVQSVEEIPEEQEGAESLEEETQFDDLEIKRADEIVSEKPEDVKFLVSDLITQGLNILASPPKCGKSTFAFQIAMSVSQGKNVFSYTNKNKVNQFHCEKPCDVLLISLEENDTKFNSRYHQLGITEVPSNIFFASKWPKLNNADQGLEKLTAYLENNKKTKFVIVDTYMRFLEGSSKQISSYAKEYAILSEIKETATNNDVAFLFLHHTVKQRKDDWLASLYGSQALAGVADTILFIQRERGSINASLHTTGRDIEDQVYGLRFDKSTALWKYEGKSATLLLSPAQREIYEELYDANGPLELTSISKAVFKSKSNCNNMLLKLQDMGLVEKVGHGKYEITKTKKKK